MFLPEKVQGIFFDAGDTLVGPSSGHWYLPPNFEQIIRSFEYDISIADFIGRAIKPALQYLDEHHQVATVEQEYRQFVEFFRISLAEQGMQRPSHELLDALANDVVYNDAKFYVYEDVADSLNELVSHDYTLGIISNTWPSLLRVFTNYNLADLFSVFTISSVVGCFKPCREIFEVAIHEMGIAVDSLLFVDDAQENIDAACSLGMQGVRIERGNLAASQKAIASLPELVERLIVENPSEIETGTNAG